MKTCPARRKRRPWWWPFGIGQAHDYKRLSPPMAIGAGGFNSAAYYTIVVGGQCRACNDVVIQRLVGYGTITTTTLRSRWGQYAALIMTEDDAIGTVEAEARHPHPPIRLDYQR